MRATVQNASVWIRGQAAGSMNMDTELPTRQAIRPAPMVPTQVGSGLQYCMPSVGIAEAVIACGVVAARTGADLRHGGSRIAGAWHACPAARVGAGWAGANLRNSLSTAKAMACSRFASTGSFVPSARSSRLSTGMRRSSGTPFRSRQTPALGCVKDVWASTLAPTRTLRGVGLWAEAR
jgi:hypothetical protein